MSRLRQGRCQSPPPHEPETLNALEDDGWRIEFVMVRDELLAAELVLRLIDEGFSLDEALGLVQFPDQ